MSKTSGTLLREGVRRLLADWNDECARGNADTLLSGWERQSFAKQFEHIKDQDNHHDLLNSFMHDIKPFDCFLIAGWQPSENQLSDALAAILSPEWGHPFAYIILHNILGALISENAVVGNRRAAIYRIQRTLRTDRTGLFVRRENRGYDSRSDIDVHKSGPEGFFVRIEHKIRGGGETFISRKTQTSRLWDDAIREADRLGIDSENVFCIFLTPEHLTAHSNRFLSLSFHRLADVTTAAVTKMCDTSNLPSAEANSILGFMSFYRRM